MFEDDLIAEYKQWKESNPTSFNWWSYLNMKADLQTALALAKFLSPELIEKEGYLILKEKYDKHLLQEWMKECKNDKCCIEKMMNLYALNDFFHIHRNLEENEERQIKVLGDVLKHFWSISFKQSFPDKHIVIDVFKEVDGELFITVYED